MLVAPLALAPLLLAAAAATPPQPSSLETTRKAFAACLKKDMIAELEKKVEPDAYEATIKDKCAAQESAYRNAMVTDDTRAGIKAADAAHSADEEMTYWRDRSVADYKDYFEAKQIPDG